MSQKTLLVNYWKCRVEMAIDALKEADPGGWEAWFDDDRNVPAYGYIQERAVLIEARVTEIKGSHPKAASHLYRGIFIWQDGGRSFVFSKKVGVDELNWNEFYTVEEAQMFIDRLNFKHFGFGVLLDLHEHSVAQAV